MPWQRQYDREAMRDLARRGLTNLQIAAQLGCSDSLVSLVLAGKADPAAVRQTEDLLASIASHRRWIVARRRAIVGRKAVMARQKARIEEDRQRIRAYRARVAAIVDELRRRGVAEEELAG